MKLNKVKTELLKDRRVRKAYDALGPEFELVRELISARARANLTQRELADRMGTTQSVVARIESGRITPSFKTLARYARAAGMKPVIRLVVAD